MKSDPRYLFAHIKTFRFVSYSVVSWFLVICLAGLAPLAVQADLPRHNPVPGGIAVIPLKVPFTEKPEVRFGEHKVYVNRSAAGWSAFVGLSCDILPGKYIVLITGAEQTDAIAELVVHPYPPPLSAPGSPDSAHHHPHRSFVVTPPDGFPEELLINRNMSRKWEVSADLLDGLEPDLDFHAPAEATLSVDYGLLLLDGKPFCHDYLSFLLPAGKRVYAPAGGIVTGIHSHSSKYTVQIAHADVITSTLGNLSTVQVTVGGVVKRGQVVGNVAAVQGHSTGRLDWAVSLNGSRIDPLHFLSVP